MTPLGGCITLAGLGPDALVAKFDPDRSGGLVLPYDLSTTESFMAQALVYVRRPA